MERYWDGAALRVAVDLAGCPNRCRHCWLGSHRNGDMSVERFRDIARSFTDWRDEEGKGIRRLGFCSWWREPDYRQDYRELWELEQQLSTPGEAQRFELLSTWRLARDPAYAQWAATLAPKDCQITFFGMEENTDWCMRRKGGFQDQLLATERLIEAGISPRWQLFPTKRCLDELEDFLRLMDRLDLHRRCHAMGGRFEFFLNGMSPEGNGYALEDIRLEEGDLSRIPQGMADLCPGGRMDLGQPEYALLEGMRGRQEPANLSANVHCLFVDAEGDVYPNIAEPTAWWRLGNLFADGVDAVLSAYRDGMPPGMRANRAIPLRELAAKYGDPKSRKLYEDGDLKTRFLHQWGLDWSIQQSSGCDRPSPPAR